MKHFKNIPRYSFTCFVVLFTNCDWSDILRGAGHFIPDETDEPVEPIISS